jgi:hypothetical protein
MNSLYYGRRTCTYGTCTVAAAALVATLIIHSHYIPERGPDLGLPTLRI